MVNTRNYTAGTSEALFMLSRGHCYEPSCKARVLQWKEGKWKSLVAIAHIYDLNEPSRRHHKETKDSKQLNNFKNLILLCTTHHDLVDGEHTWMNYPAEMLIEWKAQREGDLADELDQLDLVTEEKLQEWMASAVEDTMDKILGAIDSISSVSEETLSVLRGLVDETLRLPYLDPEDIAALKYCAGVFEVLPSYMPDLYESARRLSSVSAYVDVLYSASHRLGNLAGTVDVLSSAVDVLSHTSRSLGGLSDTADLLSYSSRKLSGLAEYTPQLLEVARMMSGHSISGYQDEAREIKDAADSLKDSVFTLKRIAASVSGTDTYADSPVVIESSVRRWPWNTFWWGFFTCVIFVVTVLAFWAHAHK